LTPNPSGKKRGSSPRIKYLAWEKCRTYLDAAERDLNEAHQYSTSIVEKDFINGDLEFLNKLKEIAKKPTKGEVPRAGGFFKSKP
jgi:hypothetical protein